MDLAVRQLGQRGQPEVAPLPGRARSRSSAHGTEERRTVVTDRPAGLYFPDQNETLDDRAHSPRYHPRRRASETLIAIDARTPKF